MKEGRKEENIKERKEERNEGRKEENNKERKEENKEGNGWKKVLSDINERHDDWMIERTNDEYEWMSEMND